MQRYALGDGRLAHARLTDEAGIVLLAAGKDLDGAVNFPVAAHDAVQLSVPRLAGEVLAVIVQKLAFLAAVVLTLYFLLRRFFRFPAAAENTEGERCVAAGRKIAVAAFVRIVVRRFIPVRIVLRRHHPKLLHHGGGVHISVFHHAGEAFFHSLQILIGDTELFHNIVHGLDAKLPRTRKAVALAFRLARLQLLYKNNGGAFFASNTKHSDYFLSCSPHLTETDYTRRKMSKNSCPKATNR